MNVEIKWHDGKYPSFNIALSSKEGAEPFLEIKGCKIAEGRNGPFVSYPSRKQEDGKYWNHVWGSEKFNAVVLSKAQAAMPQARQQAHAGSGFDDMDAPPF